MCGAAAMSSEDDFRIRPGRIRSTRAQQARPFIAQALAAAQRELTAKLYETPPADACAQLVNVIAELSRAAVDKDYTVISPSLPAKLDRTAA